MSRKGEPRAEAAVEGRFLTVREIAQELGQPLSQVQRAVKALASRIPSKKQDKASGGPGAPKQAYPESSLSAISRQIEKQRRRRPSEQEDAGAAYWRARASLRLLYQKAETLAKEAREVYEFLRHRPPSELVVVHALPHPELELVEPLTLTVVVVRGFYREAILADLAMVGRATTEKLAAQALAKKLVATFLAVEEDPSMDSKAWEILQQLVRRRDVRQELSAAPAVALPPRPQPETPPTWGEWLKENTPPAPGGIVRAWQRGAHARFHGETDNPYRADIYVDAWKEGYRAMNSYLAAGGVIACPTCEQPWPPYRCT